MKSFQVCKIWWCMMISLHQCFWNIDTYLWLSLQVQEKCCGQPGFESSRLKLCAATCPFCNDKICMTLSLSLSLHMILYCCALFSFFLSWNLPWAISGPRLRLVLTQFEIFTRTYNIPCFGAWVEPRTRNSTHALAWHMGSDCGPFFLCGYCTASEFFDQTYYFLKLS